MPFKKNTAVTGFPFALISASDGSAITSGTVTGYYLLDGGTQGSISGTPVHEGNGQWSVALTAGEMNGDVVGLLFTHTSAVNVHFTIKTETKLVSELNDASVAGVADAVWDELATGHTDAGKAGQQLWTDVDAILSDTGTDGVAIADNSITAAKIADGAIDAATFAAGAINAAAIATDAIDADALANDAVAEIGVEVNAEVSDVMKTDTISEMSQQAPPATPTFEEAVMYLYMALRNKIDVTTSVKEFHNDAETVIWKKALSDSGTTYTEAEGASGP